MQSGLAYESTGYPGLFCFLLTVAYAIAYRRLYQMSDRRAQYIGVILLGALVSFCVLVLEPLAIEWLHMRLIHPYARPHRRVLSSSP